MKRNLFSYSVAQIFVPGALISMGAASHAQTEPLPSWNNGPALGLPNTKVGTFT
jgi:hypothetical protein